MKIRNTVAFTMANVVLTASLLATVALAGPPKGGKKPPTKKPAPTKKVDAVALGKKVYEKFGCANCHAIGGKGGNSGPDLTKVGAEAKHDLKFLMEKVKNPKATNPDSSMPGYEDTIKGKDLENIAAYLKSLK